MSTYLSRTIELTVRRATEQFPVILLDGARQVGKTTLLQHIADQDRTYLSLDDPNVLELAVNDAALFMQKYPGRLFIDEIQYAPGLLPYIKMAVDADRSPGRFWLTGSQQFHLMRNVTESLAGRVAIIEMAGLSRREGAGINDPAPFLPAPELLDERIKSGGQLSLQDLFRMIWWGAFPRVSQLPTVDRDVFFRSYVQTYLQRDVRDLARVGDEMAFLLFLRAVAARTGQLLNLAEIARDVKISHNTATAWLSILKTSGIVYLLEPYFTSVTKRLVKAPKLYFLDTGLCAYLTGWNTPEVLEAGAMSGPILETWMLSEILKSWWHHGKQPPFYYYRDRDKKEIDLLIHQNGTFYPVEFKKTASPDSDDVRHFHLIEKLGQIAGPGAVVCLRQTPLPLTRSVTAIPVSAL